MNKNIKEMIDYPKEGILSKEVFRSEKIDATLFCMAKNTEIGEHTSTKQGIAYVLEGNGLFNLEGKDIKMQEGVFIFMEKNAKHSLKAVENTSFLLMLNK